MGEDSSEEEVRKEYKLWPQPDSPQYRLDDQNCITEVVVARFAYALLGIYGTTEVVLSGSDAEENGRQIERALDALENILDDNKRLDASYVWRDEQLIVEKQHRP